MSVVPAGRTGTGPESSHAHTDPSTAGRHTMLGTFPLVAAGLGLLMCVVVFESGGDLSRAARGTGFVLEVEFQPLNRNTQPPGSSSSSSSSSSRNTHTSDIPPTPILARRPAHPETVSGDSSNDRPSVTTPLEKSADASNTGSQNAPAQQLTRSQNQTGLTLKERKQLQREQKHNQKKNRESWRNEIIRLHPRVNLCKPVTARLESALLRGGDTHPSSATYLGCFHDSIISTTDHHHLAEFELGDAPVFDITGLRCAQECNAKAPAIYAHLAPNGGKCSCRATFGQGGLASKALCGQKGTQHVYTLGVWPPKSSSVLNPDPIPDWIAQGTGVEHNMTVAVMIWANERLAAMFRTCRLAQLSTRFTYDVYDLRHQAKIANEAQINELFRVFPGPKIIVFDGCCVPGWLLLKWPESSVLVVASDESARWGYASTNGKTPHYNGPHGPDGVIPEDNTSEHRIIMPEATKPWFKQYYSQRHISDFGNNEVRYVPLGSREEFAEVTDGYKPSTRRKYLYSFMGAPTDISRKKVHEVLLADTTINKNRTFLYMADHWDANPNSDRNTYIKPEEYRKIMMDSVFTLCPKGHSIEQFRLYEAIESGSIPILAMEGDCPSGCPNYAAERLPPEYFASPMVIVQDWDEVVNKLHELQSNQTALLERQAALQRWYVDYMHTKIVEIEDVLIEKMHAAHLLH
jgi:hypothetical protein